jgi:hypothetical protein
VTELSPEARRVLAQARAGQARASQALRARVKANVSQALAVSTVGGGVGQVARDAPVRAELAAVSGTGAKVSAWVWPSVGVAVVLVGIAGFVGVRSSQDSGSPLRGENEQGSVPGEVRERSSQADNSAAAGGERMVAAATPGERGVGSAAGEPLVDEAFLGVAAAQQPLAADSARRGTASSRERALSHVDRGRHAAAHAARGERDAADHETSPRRVESTHPPSERTALLSADATRANQGAGVTQQGAGATNQGAGVTNQGAGAMQQGAGVTQHGVGAAQQAAAAERSPARQAPSQKLSERDSLRAEMQLLSRAESALRSRQPHAALQVLDQYMEQFRSGQLQDERNGLRLIALCALGHDPKSALPGYLAQNGDGVLHARVLEACARFTR